ncbi:MAG: Omp28-related outer membrane protein [Bacteroidota bacterium]
MNKFHLSLFTLLFFVIHSCKEVGPNINLKNNRNVVSDTTYIESPVAIPELKNVMIEEFTGVRCPNCPQGHQTIANIKTANPGRVISVSFHPVNSLGYHYEFSADIFENNDAQILFDYLGQRGFEPVAGIDRTPYNASSVLFDRNTWGSNVASELALSTPVNIILDKSYDSVSRELTIVTELHYTQSIASENKLTLLVSESNIISAQLNNSVIDTFYNHKDIQRAFISEIQGDLIEQPRDAGRVIIKVYKITLAPKWKPENMHIVAYVHEFGNSKIVYQGKEIEVQ